MMLFTYDVDDDRALKNPKKYWVVDRTESTHRGKTSIAHAVKCQTTIIQWGYHSWHEINLFLFSIACAVSGYYLTFYIRK